MGGGKSKVLKSCQEVRAVEALHINNFYNGVKKKWKNRRRVNFFMKKRKWTFHEMPIKSIMMINHINRLS